MSVNKVDKTTGELVTLANGTRMWIGTQSAHDAAVQAGTMPNNCMVCITDDYVDSQMRIVERDNGTPDERLVFDEQGWSNLYAEYGSILTTSNCNGIVFINCIRAAYHTIKDVVIDSSGYWCARAYAYSDSSHEFTPVQDLALATRYGYIPKGD